MIVITQVRTKLSTGQFKPKTFLRGMVSKQNTRNHLKKKKTTTANLTQLFTDESIQLADIHHINAIYQNKSWDLLHFPKENIYIQQRNQS